MSVKKIQSLSINKEIHYQIICLRGGSKSSFLDSLLKEAYNSALLSTNDRIC
jgi:hypothetical protein